MHNFCFGYFLIWILKSKFVHKTYISFIVYETTSECIVTPTYYVFLCDWDVCMATGIRLFTECLALCWVLFVRHSAKKYMSSATLGKVLFSVTTCLLRAGLSAQVDTRQRSLCWVPNTRRTMTLGKGPLAVYSRWPLSFAKHRDLVLGKEATLPSVSRPTLGKPCFAECHPWTLGRVYFYFIYFPNQTFCGMLIYYVDLHALFWHNYKSVCYTY
jgi:hypothetical protein